jgi:uncharacterized membrane protein YagU involved in acid resistance
MSTEVYTAVYIVLSFTNMPLKPAVNEISSLPHYTLTLKIILYHMVFMVSLTVVSNLMMAELTMAETCS